MMRSLLIAALAVFLPAVARAQFPLTHIQALGTASPLPFLPGQTPGSTGLNEAFHETVAMQTLFGAGWTSKTSGWTLVPGLIPIDGTSLAFNSQGQLTATGVASGSAGTATLTTPGIVPSLGSPGGAALLDSLGGTSLARIVSSGATGPSVWSPPLDPGDQPGVASNVLNGTMGKAPQPAPVTLAAAANVGAKSITVTGSLAGVIPGMQIYALNPATNQCYGSDANPRAFGSVGTVNAAMGVVTLLTEFQNPSGTYGYNQGQGLLGGPSGLNSSSQPVDAVGSVALPAGAKVQFWGYGQGGSLTGCAFNNDTAQSGVAVEINLVAGATNPDGTPMPAGNPVTFVPNAVMGPNDGPNNTGFAENPRCVILAGSGGVCDTEEVDVANNNPGMSNASSGIFLGVQGVGNVGTAVQIGLPYVAPAYGTGVFSFNTVNYDFQSGYENNLGLEFDGSSHAEGYVLDGLYKNGAIVMPSGNAGSNYQIVWGHGASLNNGYYAPTLTGNPGVLDWQLGPEPGAGGFFDVARNLSAQFTCTGYTCTNSFQITHAGLQTFSNGISVQAPIVQGTGSDTSKENTSFFYSQPSGTYGLSGLPTPTSTESGVIGIHGWVDCTVGAYIATWVVDAGHYSVASGSVSAKALAIHLSPDADTSTATTSGGPMTGFSLALSSTTIGINITIPSGISGTRCTSHLFEDPVE